MNNDKILTVALTGGVASGKSAVSQRFVELGAPVVDTDVLSREAVAPGSDGLAEIEQAFGASVIDPDGGLDRAALRQRIFDDPAARVRLERILHPRIAAAARHRLAALDAPYAVLVVPLLVESGLFADADRVLVVDVPEEIQIERLIKRDGTSREQAEAMLAAQASREQRLARADDVIENTGTLEELHRRVDELAQKYRELSAN